MIRSGSHGWTHSQAKRGRKIKVLAKISTYINVWVHFMYVHGINALCIADDTDLPPLDLATKLEMLKAVDAEVVKAIHTL